MRVISGKFKGRVLKGYDIEGTRPTMDRVKESLFASIYNYLEDAIVLDLFAGSGNLGIEAISNGANRAYFVDCNKKCISAIKDNLSMLDIDDCNVILSDYRRAIDSFGEQNIRFDIIFVDPPYKDNIKNEILNLILNKDILSDNGIVVFEYQSDEELSSADKFFLLKNKKYGDKYVSVYRKELGR